MWDQKIFLFFFLFLWFKFGVESLGFEVATMGPGDLLGGCRRMIHWGPMVALFTTGYIYLIAVLDLLDEPLTGSSFVDFIIFSLMEFRVLSCFFLAVFKHPGNVDCGWPERSPNLASSHLRVCQICQVLQPPRTHHCRSCGRCVKKRDHHCPWINNCVGLENERAFFFFVTSAAIVCFIMFFWLFWSMWVDESVGLVCFFSCIVPVKRKGNPQRFAMCRCWKVFRMVLAWILSGITSLATGNLAFAFYQSIKKNTTLIEEWMLDDYKKMKKIKTPIQCPYDLGVKTNWTQFVGTNPFVWILPIFSHELDGLTWPVREGTAQYYMDDIRKELTEGSFRNMGCEEKKHESSCNEQEVNKKGQEKEKEKEGQARVLDDEHAGGPPLPSVEKERKKHF